MFKQKDIVKFGDLKGWVIATQGPNPDFPLQVLFSDVKMIMGFRADGQFFAFEKGPRLVLVKRPRKSLKLIIKEIYERAKSYLLSKRS